MRRTSIFLNALCMCGGFVASAGDVAGSDQRRARWEERWAAEERDHQLKLIVLNRAWAVRPRRRDAPLREINISDNEMREVQAVTARYVPRAYVNVSPVVTGCPCEEGPDCKDQLYVTATANGQTLGVQLSNGRNGWVVGEVQKWWLRYQRLLDRRGQMEWREFDDAEMELVRDFPTCTSPDLK